MEQLRLLRQYMKFMEQKIDEYYLIENRTHQEEKEFELCIDTLEKAEIELEKLIQHLGSGKVKILDLTYKHLSNRKEGE